ncbi:hypothetical protein PAPYR_8413 [Paratrimastix pyriformis]|uniref:Uncharacterized protein n=1 Tax=Paratrimastix pyriformis TaxID=342808 RepID=A0ABQ8UAP8_9EUKA|nr:hypothetical protein PAPYR_8413 [Paratrimastix pyriformis]
MGQSNSTPLEPLDAAPPVDPIVGRLFSQLPGETVLLMMSLAEDPTLMYLMLLGLNHATRTLVRGNMRTMSFSGIHRDERVRSFFPAPTTNTPPDPEDDLDLVDPTRCASAAAPTADALAALVGPCTRLEELTLAPERALWCGGREASTFAGWVDAAFRNHPALHTLRIPRMTGLSEKALCAILAHLDGQLRVLEVNTASTPSPVPGPGDDLLDAVAQHCKQVEVLRLGLRDVGQPTQLRVCTQLRELLVTRARSTFRIDPGVTAAMPNLAQLQDVPVRPVAGVLDASEPPTTPDPPLEPLTELTITSGRRLLVGDAMARFVPVCHRWLAGPLAPSLTTVVLNDDTGTMPVAEFLTAFDGLAGLRHLTMLIRGPCPVALIPQTLLDRLADLSMFWTGRDAQPVIASAGLRTFSCGTAPGSAPGHPARVRLDCPKLAVLNVATMKGWAAIEFQLNTPRLKAIRNLNKMCRVATLCPLPLLEALSTERVHEVSQEQLKDILAAAGPLRHIAGLQCNTLGELQEVVERWNPRLVTLQRIRLNLGKEGGVLTLPPASPLRSMELILSDESRGPLVIRAPGLVHLELDLGASKCVTLDTPSLRHLHLRDRPCQQDADVRLASPLSRLRSLRLACSEANHLGFFERLLANPLPQLRAAHCSLLRLGASGVNKVLRWLAAMPRLTTLSLAAVRVDVLDVTVLPRLARLQLAMSRVAKQFVVPWARMEEVACLECVLKDLRNEGQLYKQSARLLSYIHTRTVFAEEDDL